MCDEIFAILLVGVGSSLHNIIFNSFRIVFVLWSLLTTYKAFYL